MRRLVPALVVLLLALTAAPAAPTCLDINGDTMRCGTKGAMAVGWTPSPQQLLNRHSSKVVGPGTLEVLEVFGAIGLFLALIALMPEFDGTRAGDWDKQEGDEEASD
jgi:hypothetical protein